MDPLYWLSKQHMSLLLNTRMKQSMIYAIDRKNIFHFEGTLSEGYFGMGRKWIIIFKGYDVDDLLSMSYTEYLANLIELFDRFDIFIYRVGFMQSEMKYYQLHYDKNSSTIIDDQVIHMDNISYAIGEKIKKLVITLNMPREY